MNIKLIKNPPILEGKELVLIPLTEGHKSLVFKIVSNSTIRNRIQMDVLDKKELFNPWWKNRMDALEKLKLMHWAVFLKKDDQFCGLLTLKEIDQNSKRAELGYSFLPEFWGKGIGSSAVKLVFDFATNEINFHSLFAQVLEINEPSQKILKKLGFQKEGHFKDCHFHKGTYFDILQFGMLIPDNGISRI